MVCHTNFATKVFHLVVALPLASVLFVILLQVSSSANMMTGGIGDQLHPSDTATQEEVDQLKQQLEEQSNRSFSTFEVVSYRTQIVAGTNKFVKVKVGDNEYAHLRIFIPLTGCGNAAPSLAAYQLGKTESDKIVYIPN